MLRRDLPEVPEAVERARVEHRKASSVLGLPGNRAGVRAGRGLAARAPPPPRRGAPPPLPQQYDAGETFEEPAAEATPPPTRAAAPPSRFGYWIAVIAVGLLMVAGGIFAAVYFKK